MRTRHCLGRTKPSRMVGLDEDNTGPNAGSFLPFHPISSGSREGGMEGRGPQARDWRMTTPSSSPAARLQAGTECAGFAQGCQPGNGACWLLHLNLGLFFGESPIGWAAQCHSMINMWRPSPGCHLSWS